MESRAVIGFGGTSFIVGALAFVGAFGYLAAQFDYPAILDGTATQVLPRLRGGGSTMRTVWAVYAFLPLLLLPGAVAVYLACPSSRGRMTLALPAAAIGALAMCLGLIRWPSVHWVLAEAYTEAGPDTRESIGAVFRGLNLYLGNYIGEFLGELCLGVFFLLAGLSMLSEARFPRWAGFAGVAFSLLFLVGALRNAAHVVQPVADLNNVLLPLWMVVLGALLLKSALRGAPHRPSRFEGSQP